MTWVSNFLDFLVKLITGQIPAKDCAKSYSAYSFPVKNESKSLWSGASSSKIKL